MKISPREVEMKAAIPLASIEVGMHVVEYDLGKWHLLRDGDDFFLDVRTGLFGSSFWLLMQLDADEIDEYVARKRAYVKSLVQEILKRPHFYFIRNQSVEKQKAAFDAVNCWRHGPGRPRVDP